VARGGSGRIVGNSDTIPALTLTVCGHPTLVTCGSTHTGQEHGWSGYVHMNSSRVAHQNVIGEEVPVNGSGAVELSGRRVFSRRLGRRITHQRNQAIGECAAPAEVVVVAGTLLEVRLVALGAQHVA
jgi:hypothetical protein